MNKKFFSIENIALAINIVGCYISGLFSIEEGSDCNVHNASLVDDARIGSRSRSSPCRDMDPQGNSISITTALLRYLPYRRKKLEIPDQISSCRIPVTIVHLPPKIVGVAVQQKHCRYQLAG